MVPHPWDSLRAQHPLTSFLRSYGLQFCCPRIIIPLSMPFPMLTPFATACSYTLPYQRLCRFACHTLGFGRLQCPAVLCPHDLHYPHPQQLKQKTAHAIT